MQKPIGNIVRLAPKILRYGCGILGLRKNDVWLASFPRAGSTWVRFILCNIIMLNEFNGRDVDYRVTDEVMPALGRSNILKSWQVKSLPRFIKTHKTYRRLLFSAPGRAVYILRDPRDVMVSYYHLSQNLKQVAFHGSFSDFIRHPFYGLEACLRHYFSWLPHITYFLRYERLVEDEVSEIQKVLSNLKINLPDGLVVNAVERSSLNRMREHQRKTGLRDGNKLLNLQYQVARQGKSKQWKNYFSDIDLEFYNQVCHINKFELYNNDMI